MGSWVITSTTDKLLEDNKDNTDKILKGKKVIAASKYFTPIIHYLLASDIIKTIPYSYEGHLNLKCGLILSNFNKGFKLYIDFFEYAKRNGKWLDTDIYKYFKQTIPFILKKRSKYIILDITDVALMNTEDAYSVTKILARDIMKGFKNKTPEYIFNNKRDSVLEYSNRVTWYRLLNSLEYGKVLERELDGMLDY